MAKKMLTPEQLKLKPETFKLLRKVRNAMANGTIGDVRSGKRNTLVMSQVCTRMSRPESYRCGTWACIGGWMGIFALGIKPNKKGIYPVDSETRNRIVSLMSAWGLEGRRVNNAPAMSVLFYRYMGNYDNPAYAVKVIDRFCHTGIVDWLLAS
jgi:hypothetical protein